MLLFVYSRWTYNHAGQLKSIPTAITNITYEADGRTKRIDYANGVRTLFYYSPQRRWLTRIRTGNPSIGEYLDNSYTRKGLGQIAVIVFNITGNTAENWTYGYDGVDRLINATNAYDPFHS